MASQGSTIPSAPELDTTSAFNPGYSSQDSLPTSPPPAYSEQPPPYTASPNYPQNTTPSPNYPGNNGTSVICRVCKQIIYIRGQEQQIVVKCVNCQEDTPIKPPPSGKYYISCPCNALLTCEVTSTTISCPRPNCKRILNLTTATTLPVVSASRITCGHCNEIFVFPSTNHFATCAHCNRVSSVGSKYARTRAIIFAVIGFLLIGAGAGVTMAKQSSGIYVVWIGAFIGGILNLFRSCYYCTMTVSQIEGNV